MSNDLVNIENAIIDNTSDSKDNVSTHADELDILHRQHDARRFLKLIVGMEYNTRSKGKVKLLSETIGIFTGDNTIRYDSNGHRLLGDGNDEFDIISVVYSVK